MTKAVDLWNQSLKGLELDLSMRDGDDLSERASEQASEKASE